jgi:hypothetical protein
LRAGKHPTHRGRGGRIGRGIARVGRAEPIGREGTGRDIARLDRVRGDRDTRHAAGTGGGVGTAGAPPEQAGLGGADEGVKGEGEGEETGERGEAFHGVGPWGLGVGSGMRNKKQ